MLAGLVAAKTDALLRQLASLLRLTALTAVGFGATGCAAGGALVHAPEAPRSRPLPALAAPQSPPEPPVKVISDDRHMHAAVSAWRSDAESEILANTSRCPAEMALAADRVCVDRWEASLVERLSGGEERSWSPYLPVDGREDAVRAVSRPGVVPQGYISGEQAMRACMASGKRLCTADEWEQACRGSRGAHFPYGERRQRKVCNDDIRRVHPVAEVGALLSIPENLLWREGMNNPLINQLPNGLLQTGDRAECTNEYGIFDMVGNLHEWFDDRDGTFRGGYYMDTTLNGEGCSYQTTAHDFRYHDYSTGFRCCMEPERVE